MIAHTDNKNYIYNAYCLYKYLYKEQEYCYYNSSYTFFSFNIHGWITP